MSVYAHTLSVYLYVRHIKSDSQYEKKPWRMRKAFRVTTETKSGRVGAGGTDTWRQQFRVPQLGTSNQSWDPCEKKANFLEFT